MLSVIIIIIDFDKMTEITKIRRNSRQRRVILEELRKQKSQAVAENQPRDHIQEPGDSLERGYN